jgi:glycine/D-amino acid oxidase-like deaminating enzyme
VSEEAEFLSDILPEYRPLYTVVPQARVQELLETSDPRYRAVLSHWKGCANAALLCQRAVDHLMAAFPGRFRFADSSPVTRVVLGAVETELHVGVRRVQARRIVLCTNGFVDHVVENRAGEAIHAPLQHRVHGTVGYMAAVVENTERPPAAISYLMSPRIGHGQAYFYVTRRAHPVGAGVGTLVCVGGPDAHVADREAYRSEAPVPAAALHALDAFLHPLITPERDKPLAHDFAWHGLMAYTESQVRVIGAEPRNPALLYNLGCNGVGFLPSIYGGERVARLLAGAALPPSLFDPS